MFDMERFSRQPTDGEGLIASARRGLVVLDSDAEFDLSTSTGKKNFRDAMVAAAYYSDRLHDRVTRGKRLKALAGEPNGRVTRERGPFGFLPDGMTPHPEEAGILRELVRRTLAGETQESLMAGLAARGITTAVGKPWTRAGLRQVLTRPLNAGQVEYKGEIVATLPGEPIIDPVDHAAVLAVFAARRPGRPPSGKYLCAGMVCCGLCGKPMAGRPRINMKHYPDGGVRREYWCSPTSSYRGVRQDRHRPARAGRLCERASRRGAVRRGGRQRCRGRRRCGAGGGRLTRCGHRQGRGPTHPACRAARAGRAGAGCVRRCGGAVEPAARSPARAAEGARHRSAADRPRG